MHLEKAVILLLQTADTPTLFIRIDIKINFVCK